MFRKYISLSGFLPILSFFFFFFSFCKYLTLLSEELRIWPMKSTLNVFRPLNYHLTIMLG